MPPPGLWRSSAALYSTPLLVAAVVYHLTVATSFTRDPSWLSVAGRPSAALFLIATACAGVAAWDVSRLRRAGTEQWAPVRPPLQVVWTRALPSVAMGLATVLTVLVVTVGGVVTGAGASLSTLGMPGWSALPPLVVALAAVVGFSAVGAAAGWLLSPYVGVPLVLVGSYLWHVYPPALEPLWLRHLTGTSWQFCCLTWHDPAAGLGIASLAIPAGLALAGTVLFATRGQPVLRLAAATAIGTMAVAVAVPAAAPLDVRPTQTRAGELVCEGQAPTVCLWPEQEPLRDEITEQATALVSALRDAEVEPPERVRAPVADADPDDWQVYLSHDAGADRIAEALVQGLVPETPACVEQDGRFDLRLLRAQEALRAWVWRVAYPGNGDFPRPDVSGERERLVTQVRDLPVAEQARWYEAGQQAIRDCDSAALPELDLDDDVAGWP